MHHQRLIAIVNALFIFSYLTSEAQAQTESGGKKSQETCPDEKIYTGEYRNWRFGFTIVIPADLKGHWNSLGCSQTDEGQITGASFRSRRLLKLRHTRAMKRSAGLSENTSKMISLT
jgi:hypothetical protein